MSDKKKNEATPLAQIAKRKFKLNDMVRVIGKGSDHYKILTFRDHEPCCQLEFTHGTLKRLEWMITDELELVTAS